MNTKPIFNKVYVEITNVCNLSCSFCKGTDRQKKYMSIGEFEQAATKLRAVSDYIYLHVLGEPTLHPKLCEILEICNRLEFKVIITTNGTLLNKVEDILLDSKALHKVNISLHSLEANSGMDFDSYLDTCFDFADLLTDRGKLCVLRLWNGDEQNKYGENKLNGKIKEKLESRFEPPWKQNTKGFSLKKGLFLEYAQRFSWREEGECDKISCYSLRDQIGVLVDGTVVPCCIDCDGAIALGNIFTHDILNIINSQKAKSISEGFRNGIAVHPYCKNCGFAVTRLKTR